jgi:hypothetical protein
VWRGDHLVGYEDALHGLIARRIGRAKKGVDAMGDAGSSRTPSVDLDQESLLEEAMRNTGLSDFGDDSFREGLSVLLASLEEEARLNEFGRLFAHKEILRHLENRLKVTADWKRYPEMAEVEIVQPIFVVSLPRSGSTILHELLAQDPDNRTIATWECNLPSPPPETATFDSDPRIAQWEVEIARTHGSEVPDFAAMHPMGARLPEECLTVMALEFRSQVFAYQFNVPSYEAWLEGQDLLPVYAAHRRRLQGMQWRCPRKRWVLKAVGHLWGLKEIFEIYPDARVVQTHRDPLKVIASLTSLLSMGLGMTSHHVEPHAIGVQWSKSWVEALKKAMASFLRRALPRFDAGSSGHGGQDLRPFRDSVLGGGGAPYARVPRSESQGQARGPSLRPGGVRARSPGGTTALPLLYGRLRGRVGGGCPRGGFPSGSRGMTGRGQCAKTTPGRLSAKS